VTAEALWPYALDVYGRDGVQPLLLALQDDHGQCVPYLLWSLWLAASGRPLEPPALATGAELARAWQAAAIAPLRRLRRDLKIAGRPGPPAARAQLRAGVQRLELDAERMLLQMLEDASPAPSGGLSPLLPALELAARVWGGDPPEALAHLAELAA
jgi:uncharacterized protein (TIGR02444 family)